MSPFITRVALVLPALLALSGCPNGPSQREGCEASTCHGPSGGERAIEEAHASYELLCTDCHGGDGAATTRAAAHVAPAPDFVSARGGYLRNLSVAELDAVDPAYMRFVNPGDYRAAPVSCGAGSPANPGSGCHQETVDNAQRSVMSTFVGHFTAARHQAGLQGQDAELGSRTISDLAFPDPAPRGAVESLVIAAPPDASAPRDEIGTLIDHYLPKNCTHCHAWSFGRNDGRGNFRSSGCTSCHMLYTNDGLSESTNPSAVRDSPPHPARHELTINIPSNQCEHCHYQGARIGLLYRGIVEWGFSADPPFPNIGESLHNHPPEFYLQASTDPAHPADLHHNAGMACADCHVGRDVHGDGRIYSSAKFQVSIMCENCHGNIDADVAEGIATPPLVRGGGSSPDCRPTGGPSDQFQTCAGDPLRRLYRAEDDSIRLRLVDGETDLEVPQIHSILQTTDNERMIEGMGRHPTSGMSHTEIIECHGCHTAYRQYCFGCHVTMDYSVERADLLTGERTFGAELTERFFTSLDLYFVGMNNRGKIASFCPSMQVFTTAIDRDAAGDYFDIFRMRTRRSASGRIGFNWAVDFGHVTSREPQPCQICHANDFDGCSTDRAMETFGFGTGRYMLTDEAGVTHDLTQLLDSTGEPLVDFSHEGQSAVPMDVIQRALDTCIR